MKTKIFFLSFLFFTYCIKAQIEISGIVKDSLNVIPNAHVVNLSTNIGTSSNDKGQFTLLVSLGDSIQVTSIQHKTAILYIASIVLKKRFLEVNLEQTTYELDEFEIKKHNLFDILGIDLKSAPKDNTPRVDAISLGLPNAGKRKLTQIERKIYTATSSAGLISLDLIINSLSGRIKRLKKQAQLISEDNDVKYMYNNYRFFVQDYYNIKKDDLYNFFYFCVTDSIYKKGLLKNETRMISFFKTRAQLFKQKKLKNAQQEISVH